MRNIRIFTSKGPTGVTINTDVKTWAELRPLITRENISLNNMQCTENINKTTLENDLAVLPEGDFVLFLRAIKTKAGVDYNSMDRKSLVALLTPEQKEALKAQTGKNWTNCSTPMLKEFFIANAKPSKKTTTTTVAAQPAAKTTTAKKVAEKAPVAQETVAQTSELTLLQQAQNSVNIWKELAIEQPDEAYAINEIVEQMEEVLEDLGYESPQETSEEESEDARIMRELRELEGGFRN